MHVGDDWHWLGARRVTDAYWGDELRSVDLAVGNIMARILLAPFKIIAILSHYPKLPSYDAI
jgi:hypothetical protein